MLIFDAHLDLAYNGVDWSRDLQLPIAEIRAREAGMTQPGRGTNTVSFPEMRRGEVGICVATLCARQQHRETGLTGSATPFGCYAVGMSHLAFYRALERAGLLQPIRTKKELQQHRDRWSFDSQRTPFGFILSMECADMILDPDQVDEFFEHGVRAIGLTHYGINRYGGGTSTEAGLQPSAKQLLARMESLGIALDLTHLSDPAFWQAVEWFGGRVHASHQNARKFANWQRQFTDEMIRTVIERDGVMGMALDAVMLQEGYIRGKTPPTITLDRVVENIDHICQLAGSARHVGIGSDLDGGYGTEQMPVDVDTIADLQNLTGLLERRGYAMADVAAIMHGNWLRYFGEVLPE